MKKFLLICTLSFLFFWANVFAGTPRESKHISECKEHVPYGIPDVKKMDVSRICREGYALEHDNKAKIPVWVSYTLTSKRVFGCAKRTNDFDPEISFPPFIRAEVSDYAKSGYDIGHMAGNADMRWSPQVEIESNVLSNAAPQLPALNRGPWKQLEELVRVWAVERNTPLLIHVGPIYNRKSSNTIGRGRVVVPDAFFKVVIDQKNNQVLSFIYPAGATAGDPSQFVTDFYEVQRRTGIQFALPKQPAFSTQVWPNNSKSISTIKTASCKVQ